MSLSSSLEPAAVAAKGAMVGGLATFALNEAFRQYSGVSLIALIASAGGSVAAFAYYAEPNRWKLFGMAAANTFFGVALLVVLPLWFGFEPVPPQAEAPVSFVLGGACRWLIPLVIEVLPSWLRRLSGVQSSPQHLDPRQEQEDERG